MSEKTKPHLSKERYDFFCALRSQGVLEKVLPERLEIENGDVEIIVRCSDPDRNVNMYDYHRSVCSHGGKVYRPMPLTWPGGALTVEPTSPLVLALKKEGNVCLASASNLLIRKCVELKGPRHLALYGHFPCAAADLANISDAEHLTLLMRAKDYARELYPGVEVRLFVHVDFTGYPEERVPMCTYYFNRKAYARQRLAA